MKPFKLSKLSIVVFSIFATGSVIAGNNSIGTVTVDGKEVSVVVANNQSININGNEVSISGGKYGLVVQEPGTKTDITGSSIAISGSLAALHLNYQNTTNIGSSETNLLDIKGPVYALNGGSGSGTQLNLTAKTINITSEGDFALHVQNSTQDSVAPEGASHITVNADDINIQGKKMGISAFSNGSVDIIGNLSVKAEHAIDVRGHSTVNINQSGDHTVKLDGDIVFETPGPSSQSGTTIDANVNINLTNSDSYWNGSVFKDTYEGIDPNDKVVDNLNVTLANGATWNAESTEEKSYQLGNSQQNIEALPVNNLTLDGGVVNIKEGTDQVVKVTNLDGSGGTINTEATITDGQNVSAGKFLVENANGTTHLTVNAEGVNADEVTNSEAAMESFYASALGENTPIKNATLNIAEGDVSGAIVTQVSDGVLTTTETANTVNTSLIDISSSNYLFFRSQINDVSAPKFRSLNA